ncbi:hypothetical protein QOT17_025494 [Balamuthia mandrillaris]
MVVTFGTERSAVVFSFSELAIPLLPSPPFVFSSKRVPVGGTRNKGERGASDEQQTQLWLMALYHFQQIVFDLTSTNTGIIGGLGVLLRKKRVEAWQKEHGAGSYPPTELEIKGCDDHIASLISQRFLEKMEQRLALWTKCSGPSVCNSQTVINNVLSKRLRMFPWKSSFQGLVRERKQRQQTIDGSSASNKDPHISIPRVTETRYVSFERMAGVVLEHHDALLEFFKLHSQDTDAETAKLLFQVLSNPLVTRVLHVMTWGLRWLKQLMAVGNRVKKRETYVAHLQAFFQDIVRFKQSPKQLATNLNVPWSLIEPYVSSNSKTNGMGSSGMPHDVLAFYLAQDWCDCAHMLLSKYNQSLLSLEEKEALEGEEDNTIPSQQQLYKQQQPSQQQLNEQLPTSPLPLPLFSLLNRLWKDNNNVRWPIVSAMAKVRSVSEVQLADSMYLFSNQFKLRNKARCCINTAITRKKAQEAEKDVVDYLHHINFLPSGSKLTVAYLKKFLRSKREDPRWTLSVKISTTRPFLLADVRAFIELERSHCAATNTGAAAAATATNVVPNNNSSSG